MYLWKKNRGELIILSLHIKGLRVLGFGGKERMVIHFHLERLIIWCLARPTLLLGLDKDDF